MEISAADRSWLLQNYPGLVFTSTTNGEELVGEFCFDAVWDDIHKWYFINPSTEHIRDFVQIRDSYQVRIVFPTDGSLPKLYEIGGRILARATNLGLPPRDLHIYSSGETCLLGEFDKDQIYDLDGFIDGPVFQYFFDQSYHERFGRWPRGEYSHGLWGLIENFFERHKKNCDELAARCLKKIFETHDREAQKIQMLLTKKEQMKGHQLCICGSGKIFRSCHKNLFHGLWTLQDHLRKTKFRPTASS